MDRSSLPVLNPPMVRSIGWVSGATHKLPVNPLLFLKLLLCREVSERGWGETPGLPPCWQEEEKIGRET